MTLLKNYYQLTDSEQTPSKEISKSEIYRKAARVSLKSRHFYQLYIFGLLILYCAVFYYFGEIAALFHWETLKLGIQIARGHNCYPYQCHDYTGTVSVYLPPLTHR